MRRHSFNELEIKMLSPLIGERGKQEAWEKFIGISSALGHRVRTTGGNFLTHEIDASSADFLEILKLTKETL